MNQKVYRYKATNADSYKELALFIAPIMDAQATFFPLNKTIVIAYQGEGTEEQANVEELILNARLDISITPVEQDSLSIESISEELCPSLYRKIISEEVASAERKVGKLLDRISEKETGIKGIRKTATNNFLDYVSASIERDEMKKQLRAIITLIEPLTK